MHPEGPAVDLARQITQLLVEYVSPVQLSLALNEAGAQMLWQHAVEDGRAIALLCKARMFGSARALLRPQFEALARAAWLLTCAHNPPLLANIEESFRFPKLSVACAKLEEQRVSGNPHPCLQFPFAERADTLSTKLHDHTHRGASVLIRRFRDSDASGHQVTPVLHLAVRHAIEAAKQLRLSSQLGPDPATEARAAALSAQFAETAAKTAVASLVRQEAKRHP